MTDIIEQQNQTPPQTSSATTTTTMAETEAQTLQSAQQNETTTTAAKKTLPNISFSIWPPTQRTREAVISRLIETLSSPSVLSKRYGTLPNEEAADLAKRIEEEAFAAAGGGAPGSNGDGDGIEILQVYSKEISKRMLDSVKSRSGSSATTAASTPAAAPPPVEKKASEEPVVEEAAAAATGDGDAAKSEE